MKKIIIICFSVVIGFIILCGLLGPITHTIILSKDDSEIVFIGVPHMGTYQYWKTINSDLDSCDIVLYEDVKEPSGMPLVMRPFKMIARRTKTIYQGCTKYGVKYKDHWIKSDITFKKLMEFYSSKQLLGLYKQALSFDDIPWPLARFAFGLGCVYVNTLDKDPLVYRRNEEPIKDALVYSKNYNRVGILYGVAHWKMIFKFMKSGYRFKSAKPRHPFI